MDKLLGRVYQLRSAVNGASTKEAPSSVNRSTAGAAEAIAAELNRERTTAAEAVTALTDLIVGSLASKADR